MSKDKRDAMSHPVKAPMTQRYIDLDALEREANNPDLDLLTDYLVNELDPYQVDEVRRRLDDDPAFREFAAPMIAIWQAGREVPPVPRAQLEAAWDRFTKRAGFTYQKRKRRWRILFASLTTLAVALVVALVAFRRQIGTVLAPPQPAAADSMGYGVVADSGHEMTLAHGLRVRLERGARLRAPMHARPGSIQTVALDVGTATFVVPLPDPSDRSPSASTWIIRTPGGVVTAMGAPTLRVIAHGDSTTVAVAPVPMIGARPVSAVILGPDPAAAQQPTPRRQLIVMPGETSRIVRGSNPIRIAHEAIPYHDPNTVRITP